VLAALLRATLTSTVLVVLYFRLPFTGVVEASTVVLLVVGLVLRVMLGAVKGGRERRADGSAGFAESSDQGDAGQVARSYVAKQGSRGPDREVI
jgi:hypothetical protein